MIPSRELRPLASLRKRSSKRAPGYLERCIELSDRVVINGIEFRRFTPENWLKIKYEFALPSFMQQARNVIGAAGRVAFACLNGKPIIRDQQEQAACMAVCKGCIHYIKGQDRCSQCACFESLKTRLATEFCPRGFW